MLKFIDFFPTIIMGEPVQSEQELLSSITYSFDKHKTIIKQIETLQYFEKNIFGYNDYKYNYFRVWYN